ncbi:thiol-disulfide oxidoreductase DCC family protein [Spirosoma lituiforme]
MKKLIIYDASCPMCRLYTKGMVAADPSGCLMRLSSSQLTPENISRIDQQRARHEIPLVDLDGGETLYGVDTWIYAFGKQNKRIERVLSLSWIKVCLQTLYAFISYNRRIIITSAPGRWNLLDLQPDFRLAYRFAFILAIFGLVGGLATIVHFPGWLSVTLLLVIGQLFVTCLYVATRHDVDFRQTMMDYTGHLGMSLFIGGFISAIGYTMHWSSLVQIGGALTIGQHFMRSYRLGLSPWLSICFTSLVFLLIVPS